METSMSTDSTRVGSSPVGRDQAEPAANDPVGASDFLVASGLRHVYGRGTPEEHRALGGISFSVAEREFVSIVGPSGCGKTTLLRCLSGLMEPTVGKVTLEGELVTSVPPELTLVFQDYRRSLYPWLRVADNVEFPLRNAGIDRQERAERVQQALADVGLSGHERKYPGQLSGGMQQRVSIARALAYRPTLLLMDEPFASVDAQTRSSLEDVLLEVWQRRRKTVLFVTHDIDESVYLADRVVVLSNAPSHVLAELEVDIPRPRDQIETKASPRFVELRAEVARLIRAAGGATGDQTSAGETAADAPGADETSVDDV
jgi:NitT/TauT family transport system ATP-binding protein